MAKRSGMYKGEKRKKELKRKKKLEEKLRKRHGKIKPDSQEPEPSVFLESLPEPSADTVEETDGNEETTNE